LATLPYRTFILGTDLPQRVGRPQNRFQKIKWQYGNNPSTPGRNSANFFAVTLSLQR